MRKWEGLDCFCTIASNRWFLILTLEIYEDRHSTNRCYFHIVTSSFQPCISILDCLTSQLDKSLDAITQLDIRITGSLRAVTSAYTTVCLIWARYAWMWALRMNESIIWAAVDRYNTRIERLLFVSTKMGRWKVMKDRRWWKRSLIRPPMTKQTEFALSCDNAYWLDLKSPPGHRYLAANTCVIASLICFGALFVW